MRDYICSASEEASQHKQLDGYRQNIKASWERCMAGNLAPYNPVTIKKIPCQELKDIKAEYRNVIKIAASYMAKIKLVIPSDSSFIGLCDSRGIILDCIGGSPELIGLGFNTGCIVSEEFLGTNCMGTCIKANEPTIIIGAEHYLNVLKKWAGCAAPFLNNQGDVLGAIGVVVPSRFANKNMLGMVTMAARGIEQELNLHDENIRLVNVNEVLSDLNRDVAKTASMLSHEIRNSLSTMSAYVQLLQLDGSLDKRGGNRILMEISRINKLLDDFKRLTSPAKLNLSRQSLDALLQRTVDTMLPNAKLKNVKICLSIAKRPVYAKVDRDSIQQVFANLILNAIQAMDGGGILNIRLWMEWDKSMAVIEFEDTGPGISANDLKGIFNLFYTTKKTGSGLGLPFCASIIKHHCGEIQVKSILGSGTTFYVKLPVTF
jgi:signal transduction histidine kinase